MAESIWRLRRSMLLYVVLGAYVALWCSMVLYGALWCSMLLYVGEEGFWSGEMVMKAEILVGRSLFFWGFFLTVRHVFSFFRPYESDD